MIDDILTALLDWALASASLFNTIILFWLGLTVLLNAERRAWGIWLAGCGLLLGGVFFAGHTATLDYRLEDLVNRLHVWWYPAWLCVIALPLGWSVLMGWYAGFWEVARDDRERLLMRRHKRRLAFLGFAALILVALLSLVNPFRVLRQMTHLEDARTLSALPLLIVVYPPYVLACLIFSIDALHRPGPSGRMMGDIARKRARPYLIASSLAQLSVGLLVAAVLTRSIVLLGRSELERVVNTLIFTIDLLDFAASSLIAIAVILLGKAIVSYQIFTGKTLPRRGFLRQWRALVALAAAYSVLVSLAWSLPLRPVYPLLLTTILLAISYALFSWHSSAEREDYIDHLRPFVASQNLYEHLIARGSGDEDAGDKATTQFRALCEGVLNASSAHLIPLGPLATLAGAPLSHGDFGVDGESLPAGAVQSLAARFASPQTSCLSIAPDEWGGATWAIALWSERGVIGLLLLGERRDGGLYAQEEIEIARAAGERLIDTRAGSALSGRLMNLQRRRLAESQLIDRRARRVLHDDILPQLHTAMLQLSSSADNAPAVEQLAQVHRAIADVLRAMPLSTTPEWHRRGLVGALREMVEHEFSNAFDAVEWHIEDGAEERARILPPLVGETLFSAAREAIRNAARYARAPQGDSASCGTLNTSEGDSQAVCGTLERPLTLRVSIACADGWMIEIEDDGVGLPSSKSEFNGDGENSHGGSGSGLALHSTLLAVVGGALSIDSEAGRGTRVTLSLPDSSLLSISESGEGIL